MQWSTDRILTTHTGSLPRPPELTRLYVRRTRGEAIDDNELDRLGKAALSRIIDKQIAAGVDVGNNGEQQREAFFLYVRRRMSGFGDSWTRWPRGDVERYPLLKAQMREMLATREAVSNMDPPKTIGAIKYLDPGAVESECSDFRAALGGKSKGFVEPFLTAPSPGIIVGAMKNEYYDTEEAYLAAVGAALKVEYDAIIRNGVPVAARLPRSGARAAPHLQRPAAFRLSRLCRAGRRGDQRRDRRRAARPGAAPCLLGQLRGTARPRRADSKTSSRSCKRPMSAVPDAALRQPAPSAPVPGARQVSARRRPDHHRRGDRRRSDQFRRASRSRRRAAGRRVAQAVGDPRRVMAATDCGFDILGRDGTGARGRWSGPNCRRWPTAPGSRPRARRPPWYRRSTATFNALL